MSSSISTCPHCAQQVSIAPGLEAEAQVRCPICEAEFPLRLALVNAVDAPPELVPVARVDALRDTTVQLATPPPPSPAIRDADAPGIAASPTSPDAGMGSATVSAGDDAKADAARASRPVDTAALVRALDEEQGPSPGIYGLAGHSPGPEASAIPDVTHAQAAALWRSRQKPVSAFGSMGKAVAIVLGGLLGIAVAYFFVSAIGLFGRPKPNSAVAPAPDSGKGDPAPRTPGKFDPDNPTFSDIEEKRPSGRRR